MSKSEGNFYTVRELLDKGFSGDVIRIYLISTHYRTESEFSIEGLEKAEKELKKISRTVQRINSQEGDEKIDIQSLEEDFEAEMDNDLNTAKAKQVLMKFVNKANSEMDSGVELSSSVADKIEELFQILGVNIDPEVTESESEMADLLMDIRDEAREEEDWETSDYIRERLQSLGFEVEDTDEGSKWLK
jgi:cysteinyl-tRNA synthetase